MRRRPPGPVAIDPISGFKVPWENLVRQWDGDYVDKRFADKRNPQDFVRGRPEKTNLPYSRPETPDLSIAICLLWEDGYTPILMEDGTPILTEGIIPEY